MTTTNDNNKALVLAGIKGVFIDRDATVLDRLFRDDYRQHNPQTAPPRSRRSWETSLAAAVRRCPLGVIRRHSPGPMVCPVYPRKRTSVICSGMSAKGQELSHSNSDDLTTCAFCACDLTGLRSNSCRSAA
jgi:hypothetical protein